MTKGIIIALGVLTALVVILAGCLVAALADKKKLKAEIKRLEDMFVFVDKERIIHKEVKDESDKKISDLHDGDSVANALAELSKRKGTSASR